MTTKRWEHFPHGADVGVRGIGASLEEAFESAAEALIAVVVDPGNVAPLERVTIRCEAPDDELLLVDWLNALIYEMATRRMLFARFDVRIGTGNASKRAPGARRSIPRGTRPASRSRARRTRAFASSSSPTALARPVHRRRLTRTKMDLGTLEQVSNFEWRIPATGAMRVPGVIYASEALVRDMDEKVREQVANVATLPGHRRSASYAMPDAHWGYGFPIGGVAAFDPDAGRRRLGGRRRLRHLLRRAAAAHRACRGRASRP